jgi:hypothetical protein
MQNLHLELLHYKHTRICTPHFDDVYAFCRTVMGQGHGNRTPLTPPTRTSRVRTLPLESKLFARVNDIPDFRRFLTLPYGWPTQSSLPRDWQVLKMDKRQHQHCFLSAHFTDLSWKQDQFPPTFGPLGRLPRS